MNSSYIAGISLNSRKIKLHKILSVCGILSHVVVKGTQVPRKMPRSNQTGEWSLRMESEDSKTGYLMSFRFYFCLFEIVL